MPYLQVTSAQSCTSHAAVLSPLVQAQTTLPGFCSVHKPKWSFTRTCHPEPWDGDASTSTGVPCGSTCTKDLRAVPVLSKSPKACRLVRFHIISVKICCPLAGCRTHRADTASDRGSTAICFPNTSGSAELKCSTKPQHSLLISFKGAVLQSLPAPLFSLHKRC